MKSAQKPPLHPLATDQLLTLPEVARYLRVSKSTIRHLLHKHAIPGGKQRGRWVFYQPDLEVWLNQKAHQTMRRR